MYAILHVQVFSKGITVFENKQRQLAAALAAFCILCSALNIQQQSLTVAFWLPLQPSEDLLGSSRRQLAAILTGGCISWRSSDAMLLVVQIF